MIRKHALLVTFKLTSLMHNLSAHYHFMEMSHQKYIFYFFIQSDQQENKSRVLPHLLFYRNIYLSLIVHIPAIHSRFIGCLCLEKSIIN
jgi:hypothetical protein